MLDARSTGIVQVATEADTKVLSSGHNLIMAKVTRVIIFSGMLLQFNMYQF